MSPWSSCVYVNPSAETIAEGPSLSELLKRLLPLSLSDAAMAVADPMIAMTLTRMPNPAENLAALGVVKAIAVLFESPIIMVLHASTALSAWAPSRRALRTFVLGFCCILATVLLSMSLPPIFSFVTQRVFHLNEEVAAAARLPLLMLFAWPAIIAWRRLHQGYLIQQGRGRVMGTASLFRVLAFAATLGLGNVFGLDGATTAALALLAGLCLEAVLVVRWSKQSAVVEVQPVTPLPSNVPEVWRYYAPLALTMILMWGGRAVLVAILSRAEDSELALAAWSASWGFVILIANLSRMVQQLVIKHALETPYQRLIGLGFWSGCLCSAFLAFLGYSQAGHSLLILLIGKDPQILMASVSVVKYSLLVPLMVAMQNVFQGFCIVRGKNVWINFSGVLGVVTTVAAARFLVHLNWPGGDAGALAVALGLGVELMALASLRPWLKDA